MSTGQVSAGYAIGQKALVKHRHPTTLYSNKKMKTTFKQRLRNWLLNEDADEYVSMPIAIEDSPRPDSEGMRLNFWKANGGFVIETRFYDRRKDESLNKMYVITEDKNLGEELGKIITMESLR